MINKKKLWFLTLFSLILVLSIYYVTMPEELLLTNAEVTTTENDEVSVEVEESDILVALRVEADKQLMEEMEDLQIILTDVNSTVDEKNKAFDELKELNNKRGIEEKLEEKITTNLSLNAFVKIDDNQVRVVIKSNKHDSELANKIMRLVQEDFDKKMTISVKFQTS